MKKLLSMAISSVLTVSLLAGCGPKVTTNDVSTKDNVTAEIPETAEKQPEPVTISIGFWPAESKEADNKVYEEYKRICEEKYPWITIVPDYYDYTPETFIAKAESGQLPTVFTAWLTETNKLIENGYVADLTETVKKYGYDTALNKGMLDLMSKDGKIYGLPRDGYALGLYMNVDMFKEAGLVDAEGMPKYPKTFDELAEMAKTITDKTGKAGMFMPTQGYNGGWHFNNIAWNFGAQFEKEVDGKWVANLNSPEVIAALQYVKDLKWKHNVLLENAMLGWPEWIQNFGTEQVAMVLAAPDAIDLPVNDYKLNKDKIAIAPVPAGPGGQYSLMGGTPYMFASNATPEQLDAAFKFLEITGYTPKVDPVALAGREQQLKDRADKGIPVGPQPLQAWINPERVSAESALYDKYCNVNMDLFKPYYDNVNNTLHAEEPYYTQDLYAILDECIQKVILDQNADPKAVLEEANKKFQDKFMNNIQ